MRTVILLATCLCFSNWDRAVVSCVPSTSNQAPAVGMNKGSIVSVRVAPLSRDDLAKVADQWAGYWMSKQLDQLVALYAEDAVFLTGQGDRFSGKSAIRDIFKKALETNSSNISVRSIRTEVADSLAYDSGDYHEVITPAAGGNKLELTGNYIIVFRKQKGKWLIVEHAWTDKPSKS